MPERVNKTEVPIEDCRMTLEQALEGKTIPEEIRVNLVIIDVIHLSFDGRVHKGQMVVHKDLEKELLEIFAELLALEFPIHQVIPIVKYSWLDEESMNANNSSAFNYRMKSGRDELSNHALGIAVDINPFQNPCIEDGVIEPEGAIYDKNVPGTITDEIVEIFTSRGWTWGGNWNRLQDYHHFEKTE